MDFISTGTQNSEGLPNTNAEIANISPEESVAELEVSAAAEAPVAESFTESDLNTPLSPMQSSTDIRGIPRNLLEEFTKQEIEASSSKSPLTSPTEGNPNSQGTSNMEPQPINTKINSYERTIRIYMNEFIAVRNTHDGFFICKSMEHTSKSTSEITVQWLTQKEGKYTPGYYDMIDVKCILTYVKLTKVKRGSYELPREEEAKVKVLLREAIELNKVEDQLKKKKSTKRGAGKSSKSSKNKKLKASTKRGPAATSEVYDN